MYRTENMANESLKCNNRNPNIFFAVFARRQIDMFFMHGKSFPDHSEVSSDHSLESFRLWHKASAKHRKKNFLGWSRNFSLESLQMHFIGKCIWMEGKNYKENWKHEISQVANMKFIAFWFDLDDLFMVLNCTNDRIIDIERAVKKNNNREAEREH